MQHLRITDQSFAHGPIGQGLLEPLLQAAPYTLRSLQLCVEWGAHLSDLPQLLALARVCFPDLAKLVLNTSDRAFGFHQAAQEQPGATAEQLEARLLQGIIAGVTGLAGTLTELKLDMPAVALTSLGALTALRQLRRCEVVSGNYESTLHVPALSQFPCLEEFKLCAHRVKVRLGAVVCASGCWAWVGWAVWSHAARCVNVDTLVFYGGVSPT